jgi:hypothetical protein
MTEEERRIIEPYEKVAHEREVIMADQREEIRKLEANITELTKLVFDAFAEGHASGWRKASGRLAWKEWSAQHPILHEPIRPSPSD